MQTIPATSQIQIPVQIQVPQHHIQVAGNTEEDSGQVSTVVLPTASESITIMPHWSKSDCAGQNKTKMYFLKAKWWTHNLKKSRNPVNNERAWGPEAFLEIIKFESYLQSIKTIVYFRLYRNVWPRQAPGYKVSAVFYFCICLKWEGGIFKTSICI